METRCAGGGGPEGSLSSATAPAPLPPLPPPPASSPGAAALPRSHLGRPGSLPARPPAVQALSPPGLPASASAAGLCALTLPWGEGGGRGKEGPDPPRCLSPLLTLPHMMGACPAGRGGGLGQLEWMWGRFPLLPSSASAPGVKFRDLSNKYLASEAVLHLVLGTWSPQLGPPGFWNWGESYGEDLGQSCLFCWAAWGRAGGKRVGNRPSSRDSGRCGGLAGYSKQPGREGEACVGGDFPHTPAPLGLCLQQGRGTETGQCSKTKRGCQGSAAILLSNHPHFMGAKGGPSLHLTGLKPGCPLRDPDSGNEGLSRLLVPGGPPPSLQRAET